MRDHRGDGINMQFTFKMAMKPYNFSTPGVRYLKIHEHVD